MAGRWLIIDLVGLDCLVTFVCVVSQHIVSWVDWVCVVLAMVEFMGWLM